MAGTSLGLKAEKAGWKEVRLPRWEEAPKRGRVAMILGYGATSIFYVDVAEEKVRYVFEKNSGSGLKVGDSWIPPSEEEVEASRRFYQALRRLNKLNGI